MANKLLHKAVTSFGVFLMVFGSTAGGAAALADDVSTVVEQKTEKQEPVKAKDEHETAQNEKAESQTSGSTKADDAKQGNEANSNAPNVSKLIDAKAEVAKIESGVSTDTETAANNIATNATSKDAKNAVKDVVTGSEDSVKSSFEDSKVIDDNNVVVVLPKKGTAKDVAENLVKSQQDNLKSNSMKKLGESLANSDMSTLGLDQLSMEYLSVSGLSKLDWVKHTKEVKDAVKFDNWSDELKTLFLSGNAVSTASYQFKGDDAKKLDSNALRELVQIYSGEYAKFMTDSERKEIYNTDGFNKFKDVKFVDVKHDAKLLGDMVDARAKGASTLDVDKMALGLNSLKDDVKSTIEKEISESKASSTPSGILNVVKSALFGVKVKADDQSGWNGQSGTTNAGGAGGYTSVWGKTIYFGVSSSGAAFVLLPNGKYYPSYCIDDGDAGVSYATVNINPLNSNESVKGQVASLINSNPTLVKNVYDFFYFGSVANGVPSGGISHTTTGAELNNYAGAMNAVQQYWNGIKYQVLAKNWNIWDDWVAKNPGSPEINGTTAWRNALAAKNSATQPSNKNVSHTFNKPGDEWDTGISAPTGVALNSGHSEYTLFNKNGNIWVRTVKPTNGNTYNTVLNVTGGTNNGMASVFMTSGAGQTRTAALSYYTHPYNITLNVKVNGYVRIRLNKANSDSNLTNNESSQYSLAGATYGVYSDSNVTKKIADLTIGNDGYSGYTSANLKLLTGTNVYIKETKAPKGYALNTKVYTHRLSLTGNPDSAGNFVNTANVSDTPQGIRISIHKTDAVHGDKVPNNHYTLAGAIFEVKGINGNTTPAFQVTTDASGNAMTGKIALGSYEMREVKAPVGFVSNSGWRKQVNVTSNNPGTSTDVIIGQSVSNGTLGNQPVYGETRLEKQDAETGRYSQGMAVLSDAEYTLYDGATDKPVSRRDGVNGDKITATAGQFTSDDRVVMTTTGTNDGNGYWVGVKGLYLGKYYWKETKAPTGYHIDGNKYNVDIQYKDQNTKLVRVADVISKDQVITGVVRGQKIKTSTSTENTDPKNGALAGIRVLVTSKTTGKTYRAIKQADGSIVAVDVNTGNETKNPYNDSQYTTNNHTNVSELKDVAGIKVAIYEIKNLPYDDYVVSEDPGTLPEGLDLFKDTTVSIREQDQVNDINITDDGGFVSNDKRVERYLSLRKVDEETGKVIPYAGATFKIYDTAQTWSDKQNKFVPVEGAKEGWISQYNPKTNQNEDQWVTDKDGFISLYGKLDYGAKRYVLHEIKAPVNYALHDPYTFSVDLPSTINKDHDQIDIKFQDPPAKGVVGLTKFFQGVDSVSKSDTEHGTQYNFKWDYNTFLDGAEFDVRAAEDVSPLNHADILQNIPGGKDSDLYKQSIRYHKGDVVTTLKPDGLTGVAKSDKILYVGQYDLVEVKAPTGYSLDSAPVSFNIKYDGDLYQAVDEALTARNDRLSSSISIEKDKQEIKDIDEKGKITFNVDSAPNVVFGMYAANPIANSKGTEVVPKDGLLETLVTNDKGIATTTGKYPDGQYYLKELKIDSPWILSNSKYPFEIKFHDDDKGKQDIHVYANGYTLNDNYKAPDKTISDDNSKAVAEFAGSRDRDSKPDYQSEYDKAAQASTDKDGLQNVLNFRDTPVIGTSAVWDNGSKEIQNTGKHIIVDTVSYTNLVAGRTYEFKAVPMDSKTNKPLINPDTKQAYEASVTFVPTEENAAKGSVDVKIEVDTSDLGVQTVVMFEDVYENDNHIGFHHDITDKDQSVRVVEISSDVLANVDSSVDITKPENISTLYGEVGKTSNIKASDDKHRFVDLINFNGLGFVSDKSYDIEYSLMKRVYNEDRSDFTLEAVKNGEDAISGKTSFTPSDWSSDKGEHIDGDDSDVAGFVPVDFTVDNLNDIAGSDLVVVANLYHNGKLLATHNRDGKDEREALYVPKIGTTLTDKLGEHYVPVSQDIELTDTIKYDGLQHGKEYVAHGTLMNKATNSPALDDNGKEIKSEAKFTPESSTGTTTVTFKYSGVKLAGHTLVAFESVTDDGVEVANHTDINDEDQTVYHPSMGTTLTSDKGMKTIDPNGNVTLTDKIDYKNFKPGSKVKFVGKLMLRKAAEKESATNTTDDKTNTDSNKSNDVIVINDGSSESGYTNNNSKFSIVRVEQLTVNGKEIITLTVDYTNKGTKDTKASDAFAEAFNATQETNGSRVKLEDANKELASDYNKDLVANADAIVKPDGSTKAIFAYELASPGSMVDLQSVIDPSTMLISIPSDSHISDSNGNASNANEAPVETPVVENAYVENGVAKDDGKEITAETDVDNKDTNGSATVTFKYDGTKYAGYDFVAYETAYLISGDKETEFASHKDINDEGQTIHHTDMGTALTGQNHSKEIDPTKTITLTDEIDYSNFEVGKDVRFSGVLMDKVTGKPALDNSGKEIKAETVTAIKPTDGKALVTFKFDGSKLAGKDLVAFEKAYDVTSGNQIGSHENINDKGQTVHMKNEPKTPLAKFGDSIDKSFVWIIVSIIVMSLGGFLVYKGRKSQTD